MAQQSGGGTWLLVAGAFAGMYLMRDGLVSQPAPGFSLPEAYGSHVNLESYRGRPVLLVFWMTSCGICRRELPLLSQLAPEFRRKGIEMVAIHLGGHLGGIDEAGDYIHSHHLEFTSLIDADGEVARAYRVSGVPKLVLIGSDGKIKRTGSAAGESTLRRWADSVGGS